MSEPLPTKAKLLERCFELGVALAGERDEHALADAELDALRAKLAAAEDMIHTLVEAGDFSDYFNAHGPTDGVERSSARRDRSEWGRI